VAFEGLDGWSAMMVILNGHILKSITAVIGDIELRKSVRHPGRRHAGNEPSATPV
jgi:hypothetical protein